ncbi:hypothetical protein BdWA1_002293 [Babesia duncani]|uniref:Uncharacterized protein n=1 Tax=Babesia duncani TaxID=323732 RepID=A0AAD9UNC3_9APIC|nr:hypothetical protein BdWA1_002293 [Babesia duncani]
MGLLTAAPLLKEKGKPRKNLDGSAKPIGPILGKWKYAKDTGTTISIPHLIYDGGDAIDENAKIETKAQITRAPCDFTTKGPSSSGESDAKDSNGAIAAIPNVENLKGTIQTRCHGSLYKCINRINAYASRYIAFNATSPRKIYNPKPIEFVQNSNAQTSTNPTFEFSQDSSGDAWTNAGVNKQSGGSISSTGSNETGDKSHVFDFDTLQWGRDFENDQILLTIVQELNKVVKQREILKDQLKRQDKQLKSTQRRLSILQNDKSGKGVKMNLAKNLQP